MSAPSYRWTCHKCGATNEPDTAACSSCGFPAVATGFDLAPPPLPEAERARIREAKADRNETILIFFPEGLVAAIVAITAPVWAASLMFQGHWVAGLALLFGVAAGTFGFFWAVKHRLKWVAYFFVLAVLFVGFVVHSATNSGAP